MSHVSKHFVAPRPTSY